MNTNSHTQPSAKPSFKQPSSKQPGRAKQLLTTVIVAASVGYAGQLAAQDTSWAPAGFHVFAAGTPARASEVNENFRWLVQRITPPGTIVAFAGTHESVPVGWLLCDGQVVNEEDYPELGAVLGNLWGVTEEGRVKLPDLRGRFPRGLDPEGVSDDPEREIGSYQEDAMQRIVGTLPRVFGDSVNFTPTGAFTWESVGGGDISTAGAADSILDATLDTASDPTLRTAEETRPKNVAVNYVIKY